MTIYYLGLSWSLSSILFLWYYFIDIIRLYCLLKMDNSSKNLKKLIYERGFCHVFYLIAGFHRLLQFLSCNNFETDRQAINSCFSPFLYDLYGYLPSNRSTIAERCKCQPIWFNWSVRRLLWCLFFLWLQKYMEFYCFLPLVLSKEFLNWKKLR